MQRREEDIDSAFSELMMKIIYEYKAADEKALFTSIPHYALSVTVYPSSFVADYSNFALWESNIYE